MNKRRKRHFECFKDILYKKSFNRQAIIIFSTIMILTLVTCGLVSRLFLGKFYMYKKSTALINGVSLLEKANNYAGDDNLYDVEISKYVARHNMSVVLYSSIYEPIFIYSNEPQNIILQELKEYFSDNVKVKYVIKKTDSYSIVRKVDGRTNMDFLEIGGVLSDGSVYMLRTPMESIEESTRLSNTFLLYIGIISIVISSFFIYVFARKITKPVLELADISNKMTHMDFGTKYTFSTGTEIDLLGNNINKLLETLEKTISELKEANIELKQDNEEKTQVDEMRKEFLSNVSHELKTPIALVQGYAEGLKECVNDEGERDYYCDVIIDETQKMNSIVKKLLTLNQLEFGYNNVSMEHFDINALINNYISSSDIIIRQNEIELQFNSNESCFVWADEFMIEEVINNYFTNAVNYCESINDRPKQIIINVFNDNKIVKVNVFNTGKHIPEDSINHIWEKFYKVDKARTRIYGGSGVGLSIVKAIMESMGQQYGVENVEGGVNFWFTVDAESTM